MPLIRKRGAQADLSPSPPPPAARRRRTPESTDLDDAGLSEGTDSDGRDHSDRAAFDQMVKNLVRLAMAHEYTRQPLRRADIVTKILAPNHNRMFKHVFANAQAHLEQTFGMSMTELPQKDRVTIQQKRAAQRAAGGNGTSQSQSASSASSKQYVVLSIMPAAYRRQPIIVPSHVPLQSAEAGYIGFTTLVVGLVYLSAGQRISEGKLERYLKKCNAENLVLEGQSTEKVLRRMERDGYIVKIREREAGGEETVDWIVGPRGKVEIGERGVAELVKTVYGKRDVELEELEDRLEQSLGVGTFARNRGGGAAPSRRREGEVEEDGEEEQQEEERDEDEEMNGNISVIIRSRRNNDTSETQRRSRTEQQFRRTANSSSSSAQPRRRSGRNSGRFVDEEAEDDDDDEEEEEEEEEE